ncbi:otu domain-containing protein [Anaeramoeba flamelloides]|uniref:Otu domain-containing protein n=1 Tax=Anaeramoeba flamelloides TaxID=1746091 RepID=A0AAV7YDT1_9EUKA|nr:otu domain-containing protein [Anaeramoeba flamelloides]
MPPKKRKNNRKNNRRNQRNQKNNRNQNKQKTENTSQENQNKNKNQSQITKNKKQNKKNNRYQGNKNKKKGKGKGKGKVQGREQVDLFENENQEEKQKYVKGYQKRKKQYQVKKETKIDKEFAALKKQLIKVGLKIREVKPDGNCLFRSVADQMHGDPNLHSRIRSEVTNFMTKSRMFFEPFIEIDFNTYIKKMIQDRTWGGHVELQAISACYCVNIVVHQADEKSWRIKNFDVPFQTLHLAYEFGDHYDSIRNSTDSLIRGVKPTEIDINENAKKRNEEKQKSKMKKESENKDEETLANEALTLMNIINLSNIDFAKHMIKEHSTIQSALDFLLLNDYFLLEQQWTHEYFEKMKIEKKKEKEMESQKRLQKQQSQEKKKNTFKQQEKLSNKQRKYV